MFIILKFIELTLSSSKSWFLGEQSMLLAILDFNLINYSKTCRLLVTMIVRLVLQELMLRNHKKPRVKEEVDQCHSNVDIKYRSFYKEGRVDKRSLIIL